MSEASSQGGFAGGPKAWIGIGLGTAFLLCTLLVPPPDGLSLAGWRTLGLALLMASLWASEAIPIPATALLPIPMLPLLGVMDAGQAAAPYARELVFLFMGGFILAKALERWDLHRRIALHITRGIGTRPERLILGFMLAAAVLSMWISNTATTVMMMPIAASIVVVFAGDDLDSKAGRNFAVAIMLGVAYAASIGGVATKIGTPTNGLLAGFAEQTYGVEISFLTWFIVALPLAALLLPIVWLLLTRVIYPCPEYDTDEHASMARRVVHEAISHLGRLSAAEIRVLIIFGLTAFFWVARPWLKSVTGLPISDGATAILGALLLFFIPAGSSEGARGRALLTWEEAVKIPWGVLILFGGGLSLASAISATDLASWMGGGLETLGGVPFFVFLLAVTGLIIVLTELTSNTATTAAFLPIIAALAAATGTPFFSIAVPAVLAASCAFMLPVATPPNAIVFGSGYVSVPQMMRAGVYANIVGLLLIALLSYFLVPVAFGSESSLPSAAGP